MPSVSSTRRGAALPKGEYVFGAYYRPRGDFQLPEKVEVPIRVWRKYIYTSQDEARLIFGDPLPEKKPATPKRVVVCAQAPNVFTYSKELQDCIVKTVTKELGVRLEDLMIVRVNKLGQVFVFSPKYELETLPEEV